MSRVRAKRPVRAYAYACALAASAMGVATIGGLLTAHAAGESPAAQVCQHPQHPPAIDAMASLTTGGKRSTFRRDMDAGMSRMMADMHSPGYSGDVDIDFLAMMIPHHEGAVDMARLVLQHGRDPATRMLAEEIIAGQTIEIESMQRRLASLRSGTEGPTAPSFPALGGTRGP